MNIDNLILVTTLSSLYKVETSFFEDLSEMGIIEIRTMEKKQYVHQDAIYNVEKTIRLYQELDVNLEGIDIVFNLLEKINELRNELTSAKNRLKLYENND